MTLDEAFIDGHGRAPRHSYFVPMVDLLAGVVFLLVVMLASSVLVSRSDFGQTQAMQQEIARIDQQLQAARAEDHLYLDPRRKALVATTVLLSRLQTALAAKGVLVRVDPARGTLSLQQPATAIFIADTTQLSDAGESLARALSMSLGSELNCLAAVPPMPISSYCAAYDGMTLETAEISTNGANLPGLDAARSLIFLAALAANLPNLMTVDGGRGVNILTYAPVTSSPGSPTTADDFTLRLQMAVPSLP